MGEMPAWLIWVVLLAPLVWGIAVYNGLVRLRQHCRESWSGIESELKRRHDLVPNLVEVVRGYAAHERGLFADVAQARSRAVQPHDSPAALAEDESALAGVLRRLLAVSEAYPELRASENFSKLQAELANTENRIQAARRFYNANVRDLNTRIQIFPSNLVAGLFDFRAAEYFELEDRSLRDVPGVRLAEPA